MTVRAVFLWHLHQPEYRDPQTGQPILPWVRQHASRAYTDMADALERYPHVRAVVNWAPSLLLQLEAYVGGTQDLDERLARKPAEELTPEDREQVTRGLAVARAAFGRAPEGMWPSEGSVSPEAIDLLAACGVHWCATDQGVLERSELELGSTVPDGFSAHYHPYRAGAERAVTVPFRDRELSDRIGFRYASSNAREAAEDLVS